MLSSSLLAKKHLFYYLDAPLMDLSEMPSPEHLMYSGHLWVLERLYLINYTD